MPEMPKKEVGVESRCGDETAEGTCGSGIPATVLEIAGRKVEVIALPLIFSRFRKAAKPAVSKTAAEMLETVRIYNQIPEGEDADWQQALDRAYASYCAEDH